MVAPAVALGAEPVFYPIDAVGEAAFDALPLEVIRSCRAMIVPHYFGIPRDMSRVRAFCDAEGIVLIEDCAHAFFGTAAGRPVGGWGDYAIASMTKFFPVGEGGCLIGRSADVEGVKLGTRSVQAGLRILADALEMASAHGRLPGLNTLLAGVFRAKRMARGGDAPASISAPPVARTLDQAIQAAQRDFAQGALPFRRLTRVAHLLVGMGSKERIVRQRQKNYRWLAGRLSGMRGAYPLMPECPSSAAPYVFPLWVKKPDEVYQLVRRSGIPVFRWDDRWPDTPRLDGDAGDLWARHVFQIGCHQDLTPEDLEWMAKTLEELIDNQDQA